MMAELLGRDRLLPRPRRLDAHRRLSTSASSARTASSARGFGSASGRRSRRSCAAADQVASCFFGDGAANQGAFHEALNLAAIWKLPVVFVCENNQFALSRRLATAAPSSDIADARGRLRDARRDRGRQRRARGGGAAARASKPPARGDGPSLIEAKTFRRMAPLDARQPAGRPRPGARARVGGPRPAAPLRGPAGRAGRARRRRARGAPRRGRGRGRVGDRQSARGRARRPRRLEAAVYAAHVSGTRIRHRPESERSRSPRRCARPSGRSWRPTRRSSSWGRTSARPAESSGQPRACRSASAQTGCATPPSPSAASSAPASERR